MNWIFEVDKSILLFIQQNIRSDFLDSFFKLITVMTDNGLAWILLTIILIAFKKTRQIGFCMMISLLLGMIFCNYIIKPLVQRDRPCDIMLIDMLINRPKGYSFPSGHTTSAFASMSVIFLYNKEIGIFALLLALVVGFSRIYLFVHYPTDVLAGALLGFICAKFSFRFINKF